jgi:hypothetical protein
MPAAGSSIQLRLVGDFGIWHIPPFARGLSKSELTGAFGVPSRANQMHVEVRDV